MQLINLVCAVTVENTLENLCLYKVWLEFGDVLLHYRLKGREDHAFH